MDAYLTRVHADARDPSADLEACDKLAEDRAQGTAREDFIGPVEARVHSTETDDRSQKNEHGSPLGPHSAQSQRACERSRGVPARKRWNARLDAQHHHRHEMAERPPPSEIGLRRLFGDKSCETESWHKKG